MQDVETTARPTRVRRARGIPLPLARAAAFATALLTATALTVTGAPAADAATQFEIAEPADWAAALAAANGGATVEAALAGPIDLGGDNELTAGTLILDTRGFGFSITGAGPGDPGFVIGAGATLRLTSTGVETSLVRFEGSPGDQGEAGSDGTAGQNGAPGHDGDAGNPNGGQGLDAGSGGVGGNGLGGGSGGGGIYNHGTLIIDENIDVHINGGSGGPGGAGGHGGSGGKGGDGGAGGNSPFFGPGNGGNGGFGGGGGAGGNGGGGGAGGGGIYGDGIMIIKPHEGLDINVKGGFGGDPGVAGSGGGGGQGGVGGAGGQGSGGGGGGTPDGQPGEDGANGSAGAAGAAGAPGESGPDDPDGHLDGERSRILFNEDWWGDPFDSNSEHFVIVSCGLTFAQYSDALQRAGIDFPSRDGYDLMGWAPRTGPLPDDLGDTVPVDTLLTCDTWMDPALFWVAMWEPTPGPGPTPDPDPTPDPAPSPTPGPEPVKPTPPKRVETAA